MEVEEEIIISKLVVKEIKTKTINSIKKNSKKLNEFLLLVYILEEINLILLFDKRTTIVIVLYSNV